MNAYNHPIPVHPQPGFYETTVGFNQTGDRVTPAGVTRIMKRQRWTFAAANRRATQQMRAAGWVTRKGVMRKLGT